MNDTRTLEDAPIRARPTLENAPPAGILDLRAWVAQLVEQWIENPCVGGSIPSPGTTMTEAPARGPQSLWKRRDRSHSRLRPCFGVRSAHCARRTQRALDGVRPGGGAHAPEEGIPSPG